MNPFKHRDKRDSRLAISIMEPNLESGTSYPAPELSSNPKTRTSLIDYSLYALVAILLAAFWQALICSNLGLDRLNFSSIVVQVYLAVLLGIFCLKSWLAKLISGLLFALSVGVFAAWPGLFMGLGSESSLSSLGEQSQAWLIWFINKSGTAPEHEPILFIYLLLICLTLVCLILVWYFPSPQFLLVAFVAGFFFQSKNANAFDSNKNLLFAGIFLLILLYARQASPGLHWRSFIQIPAVLPASLILILLFFLYNALPQYFFQNQKLYDSLEFVRERFKREESLPDTINYYEFSLRDLGYYPAEDRLGGPLELESKPYMRFSGPSSPTYLRGTIYRDFQLNRWLPVVMDPNYIFRNDDPRLEQRKSFGLDQTLVPQENLESLYDLESASIKPIEQPVQVIFSPGRLVKLGQAPEQEQVEASESDSGLKFFFNPDGQIYASHIIPGPGYNLEAYFPRQLSYADLELAYNGLVGDVKPEQLGSRYAKVIENSDPKLAKILYASGSDDFNSRLGRLFLARDYLARNYKYNLKPSMPGPNEDFMLNFLTHKEGYCTYFATAMTLVARELGLESRYVEGFLVPGVTSLGVGRYEREVLTTDAHAWTEVYIPNLGWVLLDATPADVLTERGRDPEHQSPPPTQPTEQETEPKQTSPPTQETTVPPPQSSSEQTSTPEQEADDQESNDQFKLPAWTYYLLGLILVLVSLVLYVHSCFVRARKRLDPNYLLSKYEPPQIMDRVWQDMKALYTWKTAHEIESSQTILSSFSLFRQAFTGPDPKLTGRVFAGLERNYYGPEPVGRSDLELLLEYYGIIEAELRQEKGAAKYFFKRILRGPKV